MKVWKLKISVLPCLSVPGKAFIYCNKAFWKMFIYGTQIPEVLAVFVLTSTTVRETYYFFYYMCVISFKIINKHCLSLIQKACVMVVVIRTKTQWIMLEATQRRIQSRSCSSNDEVEILEEMRHFLWNMKTWSHVSHDFCKKYKIPQKLVCVMITVNISSNLRRVGRSAVTNKFKAVPQYDSSVI